MNKLIKFVSALMLAALWATPTLAQEPQYVGHTLAKFDGAQGYFVYHRACAAEFPDTVWCTTQKIIEGGPDDAVAVVPDPPLDGAWVNPTVVGGAIDFDAAFAPATAIDFSGIAANNVRALSCGRWRSNSASDTGLIFVNSPIPTFSNRICSIERAVACCTFQAARPPKEK